MLDHTAVIREDDRTHAARVALASTESAARVAALAALASAREHIIQAHDHVVTALRPLQPIMLASDTAVDAVLAECMHLADRIDRCIAALTTEGYITRPLIGIQVDYNV